MCSKHFVNILIFYVITSSFFSTVVFGSNDATNQIEKDEVICETSQGKLRGLVLKSRSGRNFYSFRGIPYGDVPERFQPPRPAKAWEGIRDAKEYGEICVQWAGAEEPGGSENCLYINIYSPNITSDTNLNVIVWIHGGGFQFGSSNEYSPEYLLDEDVVLVTVNYRLGVLGFFSTGDDVVSGNNGLKDQQLALQWVKQNIHSFGGSPDNVAIFGQSAGAVSVNLHLLSKSSEGLFQKAVAMSGSALHPWAIQKNPTQTARLFGERLNCSFDNGNNEVQEMVHCLQGKSLGDIMMGQMSFYEWHIYPLTFTAVVESKSNGNTFLSDAPLRLMESGQVHKVPYLTGITTDEGLFLTAGMLTDETAKKEINEEFHRVAPIGLIYTESKYKDGISSKLRKFYTKGKTLELSTWKGYQELFGDRLITTGVVQAANLLAKQMKVYPYVFSYQGESSVTEVFFGVTGNHGVSHTDELPYLFKKFAGMPEILHGDSDSEIISGNLVKSLVEFARTGIPKAWGKELKWKPITKHRGKNLWYSINKETELEDVEGPLKVRIEMWRDILKEEEGTNKNEKTEL